MVDCWSRNPARLAATFSTLDVLAPGRVIVGIGVWWDPLAAKVGISRARPLGAMREIVTVVRALLHDETVDRTTDGRGLVSALTYAEIADLSAGRWFGEDFAEERVPLLRDALCGGGGAA